MLSKNDNSIHSFDPKLAEEMIIGFGRDALENLILYHNRFPRSVLIDWLIADNKIINNIFLSSIKGFNLLKMLIEFNNLFPESNNKIFIWLSQHHYLLKNIISDNYEFNFLGIFEKLCTIFPLYNDKLLNLLLTSDDIAMHLTRNNTRGYSVFRPIERLYQLFPGQDEHIITWLFAHEDILKRMLHYSETIVNFCNLFPHYEEKIQQFYAMNKTACDDIDSENFMLKTAALPTVTELKEQVSAIDSDLMECHRVALVRSLDFLDLPVTIDFTTKCHLVKILERKFDIQLDFASDNAQSMDTYKDIITSLWASLEPNAQDRFLILAKQDVNVNTNINANLLPFFAQDNDDEIKISKQKCSFFSSSTTLNSSNAKPVDVKTIVKERFIATIEIIVAINVPYSTALTNLECLYQEGEKSSVLATIFNKDNTSILEIFFNNVQSHEFDDFCQKFADYLDENMVKLYEKTMLRSLDFIKLPKEISRDTKLMLCYQIEQQFGIPLTTRRGSESSKQSVSEAATDLLLLKDIISDLWDGLPLDMQQGLIAAAEAYGMASDDDMLDEMLDSEEELENSDRDYVDSLCM